MPVHRLLALTLIPFLAGTLSGREAIDIPYTLHRLAKGNIVYFYDYGFKGVYINRQSFDHYGLGRGRTETKVFSNVLVYAAKPYAGFGGSLRSYPGIKSWVDPKGHVHSLSALREQMRFNRRLIALRGEECANEGCRLEAGRVEPLVLRALPLTGVVDRPTLKIPLMLLELRFDRLHARLNTECALRESSGCRAPPWSNDLLSYWATALREARGRLDAYEALLDAVPMREPEPLGWARQHNKDVPYGQHGGGLEDMGIPGSMADLKRFRRRGVFLLEPKDAEPELVIATALDPMKFTPEARKELEEARLEALEAIESAEEVERALPAPPASRAL